MNFSLPLMNYRSFLKKYHKVKMLFMKLALLFADKDAKRQIGEDMQMELCAISNLSPE